MSVSAAGASCFHCVFCNRTQHDGYQVTAGVVNVFVCAQCVDKVRVVAQELEGYIAAEQARKADEQRAATDAAMLELAAALKAHTAAMQAAAPQVAAASVSADTSQLLRWRCWECGGHWEEREANKCPDPECGSTHILIVAPENR